MQSLRLPTVENKYNLDIAKCKALVIKDKTLICSPHFRWNKAVRAWCRAEAAPSSMHFGLAEDYWIGLYDDNAKQFPGQFKFMFSSDDGLYPYNFERFFDYSEIRNIYDLEIQELFLKEVNQLIDVGILGFN